MAQFIWLSTEKKMLSILIAKDSAWHEKEGSGVKIKRIERGSLGYKDVLYAFVNNYIETIVSFIGMSFILYKLNPQIGLATGMFIIVYFTISKYLQKKCIAAAHEFNVQEDLLSGQVFETVNHIRTIRVLNIGKKIIEKVNVYISSMLGVARKRIFAFQFRTHFMATFSQVFKVFTILFLAYSVINGRYEVGFIVLFISYFDKIWEIVLKGHGYSVKEIKNVSFNVKRGEKIGIVGLSGAGKSTLFKLLIKERDDYEGNIKIDNVNIIDIKRESFYKKVSIVLQDTEVFNFSLKENIIISDINKKPDEKIIEKAIEVSHVKDFIHKLQNGINTVIGEKGVKLSGGERQRLGIARAIYKEPEILLLDEATSHLDLESEEKIQDSLKKFFKGVTAIVIAHRLTTIKEMDKIIVFEDGKIKEQGSFDELMSKKGRFNELWSKQLI